MGLHNFLFGFLGNITGVLLLLSPLPTMVTIIRKGSIQEFSYVPYIMGLFDCGVAVWYDSVSPVKPVKLCIISEVGIFIGICYVAVFVIYAHDWSERLKILGLAAGLAAIFGIFAWMSLLAFHDDGTRRLVYGAIAASSNIINYASPIFATITVVRTKSGKYMPLLLSTCIFFNGLIWFIYARFIDYDPYTYVPNLVGLILGGIQLLVYGIYNKAEENETEQNPAEETVHPDEENAAKETVHPDGPNRFPLVASPKVGLGYQRLRPILSRFPSSLRQRSPRDDAE